MSNGVGQAGLRLNAYRWVNQHILEKTAVPLLFSRNRIEERFKASSTAPSSHGKRVWFHAASVGELESLWNVILAWATQEGSEIIVTILSESAKTRLRILEKEIRGAGGKLLYLGYSPWEGRWADAVDLLKPDLFVTVKYEAWPELWAALGVREIGLIVVGASARRSLRVAKGVCGLLGARLPAFKFCTVDPSENEALRKIFPSAQIEWAGEPRWDRVSQRAGGTHPRVSELVKLLPQEARPWGVFGSAWPDDIRFWEKDLAASRSLFWIVPHRIDEAFVAEIVAQLKSLGFLPYLSSQISEGHRPGAKSDSLPAALAHCIVVDEMGFLLELYSIADFAIVGGGWAAGGVHSTMEPSIFGIPVAAGPKNTEKFPEINHLKKSGQLTILTERFEAKAWLAGTKTTPVSKKEDWKKDVQSQGGGTGRILTAIGKMIP